MLRNYLKTAFRNLTRNKGFSTINIVGLAVGMASTILILIWIQNELSHDRFHENTSRLYLVATRHKANGNYQAWTSTPSPLASVLKQDYAEVEDATRFQNITFLLSANDKHFNLRGAFVDPSFLSMFSFPLQQGSGRAGLEGNSNIVITQQLAKKLFGDENAVGKIIRIDSVENFMVAGVLKDLPNNTQFEFEYLLPWTFLKRLNWDNDSWGNSSLTTFALLKRGSSEAGFDEKVKNIISSHSDETIETFTQPLSRMHLYGKADNGKFIAGKIELVRLFAVIAGFILLIACINLMNLSTARSEKRAREVGVRKVAGAGRKMLIFQFMGESILTASIAGILAVVLVQISLPAFGTLVGKSFVLDFSNPVYWLLAILFIIVTGLISGSYPALYLSSFQPVKVLKGTFRSVNALVTLRKFLVVLQFSFAIILIIGTIVVKREIDFVQNRDAGYSRNNLVFTFIQGDADKNYNIIKQELLKSGAAIAVTRSANPITRRWNGGYGFMWPGSTEEDKNLLFVRLGSDADFTRTIGTRLIAGRDIDIYNYPGDTTAMLLNESAIKAMGLKNPIGQKVKREGDHSWEVVGVVKDFILESPFESKVNPMMITGPTDFFQVIHFKLNPANTTEDNIAKAESIFTKYNPEYPFEYVFADEAYATKFNDERRSGKLAALFGGLSIFISCLGLFGLATYMAESRIKEIGVRKVLGSSVSGIVTLLSKDFVKLVLIAFIVASPVAWYIMNQWLKSYSYRISINWKIFAMAGLLSLLIAVLTVSYQAVKAALASPARSLRTE